MSIKTAILHKGKDAALRRFHPWVFSGAIRQWKDKPEDGEIVEVRSADGEFLGTGHFQNGSIQVRVFSFAPVEADVDFWEAKLQNAFQLRQSLGLIQPGHTDCYRLVHGEGDGLPGLVIDVYGATAVLQCHSIGMHRQREQLTEALQRVLGDALQAVFDKSADALPSEYGGKVSPGYLFGQATAPGRVFENGLRFEVDWEGGQKTGFFLDQRDNRELLRRYAAGKTVLNAFSYTGGFSIYALAAGATVVDSVDSSAKAMDLAANNATLNGFDATRHRPVVSDVMKYLQAADDEQFDLMVVDPPAFAKSNDKRHNAVQAYKRLNALAMRKIRPGGILFTFSCSQVVDRSLFYHTIVAAALEARRSVRVLHHLRQPPDHPVSLYHPEGEYLKGLVLEVGPES
ncbi:MAG: class I SAM-dependent rRNA methyltransferase [Saprospiraceae bacterium]|nr:class I SAM-dependent rRNA methyltransferase [Saprospiraceae bacterium]